MKIAISVQYGKRHLSYRGLMCEDGTLEGHQMLRLGSELAVRIEEKGHIGILLSYGSMKQRADWANKYGFDVIIGLSLTKAKPSVLYARKFDEEGKTAYIISDILNQYSIFSNPAVEYEAFPLRERSSKLALVSYFDPQRVKYAFVLSPFSCETRKFFIESEFINAFLEGVIDLFNPRGGIRNGDS